MREWSLLYVAEVYLCNIPLYVVVCIEESDDEPSCGLCILFYVRYTYKWQKGVAVCYYSIVSFKLCSLCIGKFFNVVKQFLTTCLCWQALADTSDHEIYVSLTSCYNEKYERVKGSVGTQLVGERVKIILDEVQDLSLFTREQCLQHIGSLI